MTTWFRGAYCALGALVLAIGAAPLLAAAARNDSSIDARGVRTFERAEFVASDARMPPGEDAPWTVVALPHDWRTLGNPPTRVAWYRIRVDAAEPPRASQAVYLRHLRAQLVEVYLGSSRVLDSRETYGSGVQDYGFPLTVVLPPALWQPAKNFLYFRLEGSSDRRFLHGLGRPRVGPVGLISAMSRAEAELTAGALRLSFGATLSAGLITFFLWLARRSDKVLLWFAIACLSWALANVPGYWLRGQLPASVLDVASAYVRFGLPVPTFVLALRLAGRRWPRLEVLLALMLAVAVTSPLWIGWLPMGQLAGAAVRLGWPVFCAALLLAGAAIVLRSAPLPRRWSTWMEAAALVTMGVLMLQDLLRYLSLVDLESPIVRIYHVPVMVVAIGAAIYDRHIAALWRVERLNADLEFRLAAKMAELEANRAKAETARQEQALASERQRIVSDMHDGLGAALVALLRHVESGQGDRVSTAWRVREALREMRIAIDAIQPHDSDVAAVLGNLRYRLDDALRASGIRLTWEIAELPRDANLAPQVVFALQRIVVEAITNALKHSRARQLRVRAGVRADGIIEVEISDDGQGFDMRVPSPGLGLASMRKRADQLGASLFIESSPGKGTTVRLVLGAQSSGSSASAIGTG